MAVREKRDIAEMLKDAPHAATCCNAPSSSKPPQAVGEESAFSGFAERKKPATLES